MKNVPTFLWTQSFPQMDYDSWTVSVSDKLGLWKVRGTSPVEIEISSASGWEISGTQSCHYRLMVHRHSLTSPSSILVIAIVLTVHEVKIISCGKERLLNEVVRGSARSQYSRQSLILLFAGLVSVLLQCLVCIVFSFFNMQVVAMRENPCNYTALSTWNWKLME